MKPRTELLHREKILRDTFTPAETFVFRFTLIICGFAFFYADPRSGWALGIYMSAAPLCLVALKIHESSHPFFIELLWPRFWLICAPIGLLFVQFTAGLAQSPLQEIEIEKTTYLSLNSINPWLPTSTAAHANWLPLFSFGALYLIACSLFLIPKSRHFFEQLLHSLCRLAIWLSIFGYIQKALPLEAPLLTPGTGQTDFFAFFAYDGHWAAFALLWCVTCGAMTLLVLRSEPIHNILKSRGRLYLMGTFLLGGSGFFVEARWPAALLLLTFAGVLIQLVGSFWKESHDRHRKKIISVCALVALLALTGSTLRILEPSSSTASAPMLQQAALQMFLDSPWFGWGAESFQQLVPFYIDDALVTMRYERANSDLLQFSAEFGIFGISVAVITLMILMRRYFIGRTDIKLTNQLLFSCVGLLFMAGLDSPVMSPAVFISFWILFFTALRWADLTRNRVDEVDAAPRPTFVTPASQRKVPFVNSR